MNPAFARAGLQRGHRLAFYEKPEKIREIHAGAHGKGMPAPNARVDVEKLEAAVARIFFELDFGKPGETGAGEQALRGGDDLRFVDRLDEGAELAEILRVLSEASGHNGGER